MSRSDSLRDVPSTTSSGMIGVGLRHPHYRDALSEAPSNDTLDFVEIHAENFFARGGLIPSILDDISQRYPISLHSTSLGLGSAAGINSRYLERLTALAKRIDPVLISDHASFAWGQVNDQDVHAGDLLPLAFTQRGLDVLADNVDRIQQKLGRQILVENLSAYIHIDNNEMQETEFLTRLAERTQCGLLIDLNNILVNAHNASHTNAQNHDEAGSNILTEAKYWLAAIPAAHIGELHLAGYTPQAKPALIIDDHSQPVSDECWQLYRYALQHYGPKTTLIEWDNNLPEWHVLLQQAQQARQIADDVQSHALLEEARYVG